MIQPFVINKRTTALHFKFFFRMTLDHIVNLTKLRFGVSLITFKFVIETSVEFVFIILCSYICTGLAVHKANSYTLT